MARSAEGVMLLYNKISELADKPGSVVGNHSSGMCVATHLKQPTRTQRGPRHTGSYLVLLRVGFAVPACCQARGALLPHHFTLACVLRPSAVSFCCTVRRLAPPRCYLAPCPVEPGLSSTGLQTLQRLPGQLGAQPNTDHRSKKVRHA